MAEALNETAYGEGLVARGTHYLFGGAVKNVDEFVLKEKELALKLALHPWILGGSVNFNTIDAQLDMFSTHVRARDCIPFSFLDFLISIRERLSL